MIDVKKIEKKMNGIDGVVLDPVEFMHVCGETKKERGVTYVSGWLSPTGKFYDMAALMQHGHQYGHDIAACIMLDISPDDIMDEKGRSGRSWSVAQLFKAGFIRFSKCSPQIVHVRKEPTKEQYAFFESVDFPCGIQLEVNEYGTNDTNYAETEKPVKGVEVVEEIKAYYEK